MPPSPPLCKFPMPRRRAAALPRINVFSIFLNLCPNNSHLFCIFVIVVGTGIWVYPSTCPYGYSALRVCQNLECAKNAHW